MKYDPVIRTQIGVAGPDLAVSPGGQTYSRQSSHSDNWGRIIGVGVKFTFTLFRLMLMA